MRLVPKTVCPHEVSLLAQASPIPDDAPVTRTTLRSSLSQLDFEDIIAAAG